MRTRLQRERDTVKKMIELYCELNHNSEGELCNECSGLMDYIDERLDKCPFENDKPTCDRCTVHCYRKDEREHIRRIMRFSGPRMTYRHPVMAIVHLFDRRRGKHGDELIALLNEKD
jgi:hypothetical protein